MLQVQHIYVRGSNVVQIKPSAGYTFNLQVLIHNVPGMLGRLTTAIGTAGGDIDAVEIVEQRGGDLVREIAVKCRDEEHSRQVVEAVRAVDGIELLDTS